MKYFYTLILSLALVSTISAKTYTIRFDKADYDINVCNGVVGIEKKDGFTFCDNDIKGPALPYSIFRILRPLNASSANYKVSFKSMPIHENVKMVANPQLMSTNSITTEKDLNRAYASKSQKDPVIFLGDMSQYGFSYASFKITPFVYDIERQQLQFVTEVTITLLDNDHIKSNSAEESKHATYDSQFKPYIRDIVINPEELNTYYAGNCRLQRQVINTSVGDPDVEYLIILGLGLGNSFYDLRDWKTQKGVKADVVTANYIYTLYSSSYSHPLAIKHYLHDYYENGNHNLKWVLLAGDNEDVPSPKCKIETYVDSLISSTTPCDYYYSCFGGTFNWDANGNGILGEATDGVDLSPYLFVSRAPVASSSEAEHFVDKVMTYEMSNPPMGFNSIMLAGCWPPNEDPDRSLYYGRSQAHDGSVNMYNQYFTYPWNGLYTYYFDTSNNSSPYNRTNLKSYLNYSQQFVHMYSHGLYDSWNIVDANGSSTGDFTVNDVNDLTNSFPKIIVTTACFSSQFDYSPLYKCLGETFICDKHGAVAFIGSSRQGIVRDRTTELSVAYDGMFFKKLFNNLPTTAPRRLGAVLAETKKEFIDLCYGNVDGYRFLQYAINPFGDPEMPIYTSNYVWPIYPTFTWNGNDVTISSLGTNCTIAMQSVDGSLYEVAENVSDSHTFYNVNTLVRFTITEDGHRPYVSDVMYPIGNLSISGPTLICDSAIYCINNLPTNATVSWSEYLAILDQTSNYPSPSQCMLTNNNYTQYPSPAYGKLYATVTLGGYEIANLSKDIRVSGWRHASYTQYSSGSYPYIGSTEANLTTPNYINPGCEIFLVSDNFRLMNVSHSGVTPLTWSFNNSNSYLTFSLPSSSVGQTFSIHVRSNAGEGNCNNFDLSFIATTNSLNAQSIPQINVISTENGKLIRIASMDENSIWNLSVIKALTGECVLNTAIQGDSHYLETSEWQPGIYIVKCQIGEEVSTEKISVKQ